MPMFDYFKNAPVFLFVAIVLLGLSAYADPAADEIKTQHTVSCHAARISPGKDHWACTATCPKGTHVTIGGVTIPPGTSIGPLSESIEDSGQRCDFGAVTGCNKKKPCLVTCDAVCADAR